MKKRRESGVSDDEMAIGMINNKTTAARLIPVPGLKAGEEVEFGGLFGASPAIAVPGDGMAKDFIRAADHIPAPVHSLRN